MIDRIKKYFNDLHEELIDYLPLVWKQRIKPFLPFLCFAIVAVGLVLGLTFCYASYPIQTDKMIISGLLITMVISVVVISEKFNPRDSNPEFPKIYNIQRWTYRIIEYSISASIIYYIIYIIWI